jgi:hypothetical protein
MRKFLVSVALATATIASAVPTAAMAQPGWQRGGPTRPQVVNLLRDLNQAEAQISRNRGISAREAVGLRREAQQVRLRLNLAQRNGINAREFNDLRSRVSRLQIRVRLQANDRNRH